MLEIFFLRHATNNPFRARDTDDIVLGMAWHVIYSYWLGYEREGQSNIFDIFFAILSYQRV